MPKLKSLLTDAGHDALELPRQRGVVLPVARRPRCAASTRTTPRSGATRAPNGGFGRFYDPRSRGLHDRDVAAERGYRTGLFGKYLNGYPEQAPVGADVRPARLGHLGRPGRGGSPYHQFNYTLNDTGHLEPHGHAARDYLTDVLDHKVRTFITTSTKPFFAYVGVYNPHAPATPAPRHKNMFKGVKAPRTPSYDEKDLTGKPTEMRRLPPVSSGEQDLGRALPEPPAVAAVRRRHDRRPDRRRCGSPGSSTTPTSSSPPTTASTSASTGCRRARTPAYEEDTRVPFVGPRPGCPRRAHASTSSPATSTSRPTIADLAGAKSPRGSWTAGRCGR